MAVTGVHKNWELFYSNLKFYFRHSSQWQRRNIHPVIQLRICCQDSRWMSEYWWSWKTPPGPFFYITPVEDGMRGKGRLTLGFPWREAPFSIFRIPVFCAESQKEINLTLKRWGLHLFVKDVRCCLNDYANSSKPTCSWHSVPLHSLFLGLKFADTWLNPAHFGKARSG